jgi:hypothetical protein
LVPAQAVVGKFLETFKDYPPSQASGTMGIERALKAMQSGADGEAKLKN